MVSIGLILANLAIAGRPRLLVLRSTGEIWPISSHDVQFVMPSSLVPQHLTSACWSPSLIAAWSGSEDKAGLTEESFAPSETMMDARRKVAMILRKVQRETEKMCGRLAGGTLTIGHQGRAGGAEAVYDRWASEDEQARGSVTAVEAAEYLLNPEQADAGSTTPATVRPNTLPAYAAHQMLMQRPDLFTADQGDMWISGVFLVRSRAERRSLHTVRQWVEASDPDNRESLDTFIEKARRAISLSRSVREETDGQELMPREHDLKAWTADDREILSILFAPLVETRSTQTPPALSVAYSIARLISPSPEEPVDRGTLAHMLQDMGMILPWDSLETSKVAESESRSAAMSNISSDSHGPQDLLKGNELDHLREDYTAHKVYVIDDPTASELDDGIALERISGSEDVWVHIHIADPTRYIPASHPLALQASFRGSALYLPEGNKPLFPLEQVMKEMSLGAEIERDGGAQGVLTFSARMSMDGVLRDSKVKMGWIKRPRVVTYNAVDEALGVPTIVTTRPFGAPAATQSNNTRKTASISSEELTDLQTLYSLAKAHRAQRFSKAGLEWSFPSASATLLSAPSTPSSNLFDASSLFSKPQLYSGSMALDYKVSPMSTPALNAGTLVAEYMILAGRLAASYCTSRNIPVIYRGSTAPQPVVSAASSTGSISGDFQDSLEALLASRAEGSGWIDPYKIASVQKQWYSPSGSVSLRPLPHWIMGFADAPAQETGYTRATSPLRRFDDMLVHWQIKACLAREAGETGELSKGLSADEVEILGKRSDGGSKRAKRAGKNAQAFWVNHVLASHLYGPSTSSMAPAQGYNLKEPIKARISGSTISVLTIDGDMTEVVLESIGITRAQMIHPQGKEWEMGEEVDVLVAKVVGWPNPHITVRLVE